MNEKYEFILIFSSFVGSMSQHVSMSKIQPIGASPPSE